MNLPELLKTAILKTHPESEFRTLADAWCDTLHVSYDNDTPNGQSFSLRLDEYIRTCRRKNTLTPLISSYKESLLPTQKQFQEVIDLNKVFHKIFEQKNGGWVISREHFEHILIRKKMPFIDRTMVKEEFYQMVSSPDSRLLIINGESRSGLSYLRWFFNKVSESTGQFEFIQVDIKEHVKPYSEDGLVHNAELMKFLSDKLVLNYQPEQYKVTPFKSQLLAALQNKDKTCIFYIHQFDVVLAEDFHDIIRGLSEMVLEEHAPYFIILCGYPKVDNLPEDWRMAYSCIDLGAGTLTREDVVVFFREYYKTHLTPRTPSFTENEFIQQIEAQLPGEVFDPAILSNAAKVGKMMEDWFKRNSTL